MSTKKVNIPKGVDESLFNLFNSLIGTWKYVPGLSGRLIGSTPNNEEYCLNVKHEKPYYGIVLYKYSENPRELMENYLSGSVVNRESLRSLMITYKNLTGVDYRHIFVENDVFSTLSKNIGNFNPSREDKVSPLMTFTSPDDIGSYLVAEGIPGGYQYYYNNKLGIIDFTSDNGVIIMSTVVEDDKLLTNIIRLFNSTIRK